MEVLMRGSSGRGAIPPGVRTPERERPARSLDIYPLFGIIDRNTSVGLGNP
jgi:hypothetical protein